MHFIGIDLHKRIFTVCVLDDNEKVVDELNDIETDENMRMKATVRLCNQYSCDCEEMRLRIMEFMNLHNIPEHPRYKDVAGQRYMKYLQELGDPVLTSMVNHMASLNGQIDILMREIDAYAERSEDAKLLMSIKGIGSLTAVTIVTAIDGIHRFDCPEKLVSYFGLAVCTNESAGVKKKGHITKEGDPLVRKYLANVVKNHATRCLHSDLSKFYKRKKDEMPHWKAVTAAMRKLTCIIWAMLSQREPYHLNPA